MLALIDFDEWLIEELKLSGCSGLLEIDPSITSLANLTLLDLSYCISLKNLPASVSGLISLRVLDLYGCSKLRKLPEDIGDLKGLEELDLRHTTICEFPPSIALLENLKTLNCEADSSSFKPHFQLKNQRMIDRIEKHKQPLPTEEIHCSLVSISWTSLLTSTLDSEADSSSSKLLKNFNFSEMDCRLAVPLGSPSLKGQRYILMLYNLQYSPVTNSREVGGGIWAFYDQAKKALWEWTAPSGWMEGCKNDCDQTSKSLVMATSQKSSVILPQSFRPRPFNSFSKYRLEKEFRSTTFPCELPIGSSISSLLLGRFFSICNVIKLESIPKLSGNFVTPVSSMKRRCKDFNFPVEPGRLQSTLHLVSLSIIRFSNIPIDLGNSVICPSNKTKAVSLNRLLINSGSALIDVSSISTTTMESNFPISSGNLEIHRHEPEGRTRTELLDIGNELTPDLDEARSYAIAQLLIELSKHTGFIFESNGYKSFFASQLGVHAPQKAWMLLGEPA
ncbi:hypothetical protein FEM48_Zijuj10G0068200 [Ziziphus jujuba var. spinosa]|uniref:Disease resistance R13L4/SHOC-2-like LRR domain-containing protein n=1 Tax=Ziziphus jujuba var. spinosa TaxID=714518 RepID=A0A978ULY1_ZIZJJ|nr:hypothetical protein FEM48_Zijuj10G0068200 [Ziziphus jujuba var. spinosa]